MKRLLLGLLLSLFCFAARAQSAAQPTRDGLTWADGQLLLLRNGTAQPVTKVVRLPSGATIAPDGHVILANGRQGRFRAGDGVDTQTGTWFARRARNPDGSTFLPLPVRLELPAGAGKATGSSSSGRRYHYEQRRQRTRDGRRLPDKDEEDDDED